MVIALLLTHQHCFSDGHAKSTLNGFKDVDFCRNFAIVKKKKAKLSLRVVLYF